MNSDTQTTIKRPRPRPLSPHLGIYRKLLTMVTSITHRITGVALTVGTLLFTAWLVILAFAPESYADFTSFITSPFGLFILVGFTWAFCYHLSNGIRHLIWDMGYGLRVDQINITGPLVIISSVVLTAIIWIFAL